MSTSFLVCPRRRPRSSTAAPTIVVTNARIYTVDDAHPLAAAMAVRDGRVPFVGSTPRRAGAQGPVRAWSTPGGRR